MSYQELEGLRHKLSQLEERAGITKQVADAKLGPFIPDPNWSSAEYFRETEDHARRKVRGLYFGVQELDLRKQLIATRRASESMFHDNIRAGITEARAEVAKATARSHSQAPYIWAAVWAVVALVIGASLFGPYGAIGGALVGFFLGLGKLNSEKRRRKQLVQAAQQQLDVNLKDQRQEGLKPSWFNAGEERTGERDDSFDQESVIANYYEAERERARGRG